MLLLLWKGLVADGNNEGILSLEETDNLLEDETTDDSLEFKEILEDMKLEVVEAFDFLLLVLEVPSLRLNESPCKLKAFKSKFINPWF